MAFKRKGSQAVADAQQQAANLKAIDQNLDVDNGLALADCLAKIAQADGLGSNFKAAARKPRFLSSRMLAAVGVKHGKDSGEDEMAGSGRSGEIVRSRKKTKPAAETAHIFLAALQQDVLAVRFSLW